MNLAVTSRIDFVAGRHEFRDSVDQRLTSMLSKLGFCPIPVPNSLLKLELTNWINNLNIEGIVFSGGNDIGEYPNRDNTEKTIYDLAKERNLPVLGICRGMQFINFMNGGALHQVKGHSGTYHRTIDCISKENFYRNSYHNFAIRELGSSLETTFISQDGQIEGIKHIHYSHFGIMWHPEREPDIHPTDAKLFLEVFRP